MIKTKGHDEGLSNLSKAFSICILLFPLFTVYATPVQSVTLGEFILAFFVAIFFLKYVVSKKTVRFNSFYCYYIPYALISTILVSAFLGIRSESYSFLDMVQRVIRDGFYFAIIYLGLNCFEFNFSKKCLRYISICLCAFMITQFICYMLFEVYVPGVIPQFKTSVSGGFIGQQLIDKYKLTASIDGYARATGFFSEPAVCAHYLTISLIFELFEEENRINYKLAILYSIAMVLTFSVNAMVALGLCWGVWVFYDSRSSKKPKNYYKKKYLMVCMLLIAFVFILINPFTNKVIDRLFELKDLSRKTGSSGLRVMRGPAFFLKMPVFFMLFGSGFGNFIQVKDIYNIVTPYEVADEYMCTNAYILISAGIVGFIIYLVTLYKCVKRKNFQIKMLFFMLVVFSMSSSLYSSAQFVILLFFIFSAPKKECINENTNYNFA